MALKDERTAYICCVPIGTRESVLKAVLNNGNQSEYSVVVNELKQGVAVVKISGNVSWSELRTLCHNHSLLLLPDVVESACVRISSEWVRQIRDCGLQFHTIVERNVSVTQSRDGVTLEGRLADIDLAVSDIKDAVVKSVCGAYDSRNQMNGSSISAVNADDGELMAGQQTSATNRLQIANTNQPFTASAASEIRKYPKEIDEHVWRYIAFMYPDMHKHWEQIFDVRLLASTKTIELTGQLQDVFNFDEWQTKHDLMSVVRTEVHVPASIDMNLLKILVHSTEAASFNVCVRLVNSTDMECIGMQGDMDGLISWLKVKLDELNDVEATGSGAAVKESARVNGSMSVQSGGNIAVNVTSHDNSPVASVSPVTHSRGVVICAEQRRLTFQTAEHHLKVDVFQGDLTQQKCDAIVNPANQHLLHGGGAAKSIQNAAGNALINECKDYIRKYKQLPPSEVMYTTSGKLPRPINYVIHACGPNARDYPDERQCLRLLQKTFCNCFVLANDVLLVQSVAVPAISSGTFSVPLDVVGTAAFRALMEFNSYISHLSQKKRHLRVINFVNIDSAVTESLISIFRMYLNDNGQHMPAGNGIHPGSPSDTRVTSDDDSFSEPKVSQVVSPRNTCCVCGRTESNGNKFVDMTSCHHRCCHKCRSQPCKKCHSLPHAVPHSRKVSEPQVSSTDVDSTVLNNAGASAVDLTTNHIAASPSPTHRARSNSLRLNRSSFKTTATSSDNASSNSSNSKPENNDKAEDEFTARPQRRRSSSVTRDDRDKNAEKCVICMDKMTNPKKLDCGHTFCTDCIEAAFAHAAKCPCCGQIFGKLKGNQPTGGSIKINRSAVDLAGYKGAGSFVIEYEIPSGFQQDNHPNPGKPFKGTRRTAYLPATAEGEEICKWLHEAFNAGLTFTIGKSHTTGQDNVVIWNDIHHKTSRTGQYGYPDYTYLSRVRAELAAKGIGSTITSSAAVASSTSAKRTTTSSAYVPISSATSAPMSRRFPASTHGHYATSAASTANHTAVSRSKAYDVSTHNKYSVQHSKVVRPHTISTSGSRPLHDTSTLDQTQHRGVTGSLSSSGNSRGSYYVTHSSRLDDHNRQRASRSTGHSTVSHTGVFDTNRRYH